MESYSKVVRFVSTLEHQGARLPIRFPQPRCNAIPWGHNDGSSPEVSLYGERRSSLEPLGPSCNLEKS
jgi:hypothetical protein